MGIYSTLLLTRSKAVEVVTDQLEQLLERVRTGQCPDEELQLHLSVYLEPHRNNVCIVNDGDPNHDDRVPYLGPD